MIFMNMNLDWLTCMQNLEVHLQVLNKTWFNKHSKIRFEFKIHFNQDTLM
jgi:hypothetical protein